jgi:hypothetical protein
MRNSKTKNVEQSLVDLLDVLASLLIQFDITPARVSEIVRTSFVKAGASLASKKHSSRPHVARVAALTGLTRSEVKRIVMDNYSVRPGGIETAPRTLRVLSGWKASKRYTARGRPRNLKVDGAAPSFKSLCKEFSGDIPHMAILTELLSSGLVRVRSLRGATTVSVRRRSVTRSVGNQAGLEFFSSLICAIADKDRVLLKSKQIAVAPAGISPEYFEKSVASRFSTIIDSLPTGRSRKKKGLERNRGVEVFAVVTRRQSDWAGRSCSDHSKTKR